MFGGWTNGTDGNFKYAIYKISNTTLSRVASAERNNGGWRNLPEAIFIVKVLGYRRL